MRLAGEIAFVTGAGRGIGAETARTLARDGATVVVTARKGADAEGVAAAKPDLIVDIGSTAPPYIALADRVDRQRAFPIFCSTARCAKRHVSCGSSDESSTPVPQASYLRAISKRRCAESTRASRPYRSSGV